MNIMKTDARSQVPQSHVLTKFIALQGAAHKNKNYPIVHENSKKSDFQITRNPCKQWHENPSKLPKQIMNNLMNNREHFQTP